MQAYIVDWLGLLGRWVHLVTGIAWLDDHLRKPTGGGDLPHGIAGEVWTVHGGGFYNARKMQGVPSFLPRPLHWFKWEAYSIWLSGMFLLALTYWYGAEVYLIDRSVAELSAASAVGIAVAFIVGGWVVYDLLCKSPLARDDRVFAVVLLLLVALLAWGLCRLFGGRGAYIHFGAVLGTIMVANVAMVIIPGQRKMVDAAGRGEAPDPAPGIKAKQRSVHNTYFTLPVLFVMTSNHYAMTYSHEYNWAILVGIALAGALIRIYFVARHSGRASLLPAVLAVLLLAGIAAAIAPRSPTDDSATVSFDQVRNVVQARCTSCHSAAPVHPAFPAAPLGVMFDSDEQILGDAARIYQQTVVTRVMPIGNLTAMTDAERGVVEQWYLSLQDQP